MSFAPIGIEPTTSFIVDEFDQTAEPVNWNGYEVKDQSATLSQASLSAQKSILLSELLLSELTPANASILTQDLSESLTAHSLSTHSVLLSEEGSDVKGSVSVRGSADTDGNARAGVEVSVRDKSSSVSGSVSGSVSRDSGGHTKGEVKVEGQIEF